VNEVDAKVGKYEEERELEPVIPWVWGIFKSIVEFGGAADFSEEEWYGEDGDEGHAIYCLGDFHLDLVLEEFGVLEGGFIEDKYVGERRDNEVDGCACNPVDMLEEGGSTGKELTYQVMRKRENACLYMLSLVHWLMYAASEGSKEMN
jgi:hypothetical protein